MRKALSDKFLHKLSNEEIESRALKDAELNPDRPSPYFRSLHNEYLRRRRATRRTIDFMIGNRQLRLAKKIQTKSPWSYIANARRQVPFRVEWLHVRTDGEHLFDLWDGIGKKHEESGGWKRMSKDFEKELRRLDGCLCYGNWEDPETWQSDWCDSDEDLALIGRPFVYFGYLHTVLGKSDWEIDYMGYVDDGETKLPKESWHTWKCQRPFYT